MTHASHHAFSHADPRRSRVTACHTGQEKRKSLFSRFLSAAAILALLLRVAPAFTEQAPVASLPAHLQESGIPTIDEVAVAERWLAQVLPGQSGQAAAGPWTDGWIGAGLPFSFRLDGRPCDPVAAGWQLARKGPSRDAGAAAERIEIGWQSPSGLRLVWQIKRLLGFPAAEWLLSLENTGSKDSPLVEDFQCLDLKLNHSHPGKGFTVHGANGGRCLPDDLMAFSMPVPEPGRTDAVILRSPMYSSNERLPFFNLDTNEGRGMLVGLGWTGAWQAEIGRAGGALRARAGLPATCFRLRPGEQVRMPRVLALLWNGPRLHGHNMLRQLLYRHYVAHLPGKPHEPLVSVNLCFTHHGGGGFLEQAAEKNVLSLLEPCRELGVEAFVIDAGWYPCKQWGDIMTTRDFRCDLKKYPRGFRPLAEAFRKAGMAFGLWFPPEAFGTYAEAKTRDRFLGIVGGFAERDGITLYRQDAGILPSAREPDRQGVDEMQHIAGLYAMQDQLRSRFPAMVMEGCCGGGRRIDLESLSRFLWHQKSDKWFDTLSDHCGLHGANMFLPGGVINVPTSATDDFGVWSSFGGQLCLAWHPLDKDFPMQKAKNQVALYKSVRQYLSGDFYPLTECSLDAPWLAYQFHRSDLDQGFILVFKRKPSGGNAFKLAPRGLDPGKQYRVSFAPSGEELSATGDQLAQGREITLSATPAAMLVKYASAGLARP